MADFNTSVSVLPCGRRKGGRLYGTVPPSIQGLRNGHACCTDVGGLVRVRGEGRKGDAHSSGPGNSGGGGGRFGVVLGRSRSRPPPIRGGGCSPSAN